LSQLRELNPDKLKIDRSFIADLDAKNPQSSIIASVIDLAHQLDIRVTAEGIETREQAEALRRMGCELGQGFLFGRPERLPETTQGSGSQLSDGPLGRSPDGERS
jgi:EAL domain-containing protein (putative c-di-GMP-specific phosphodiesterase class I)